MANLPAEVPRTAVVALRNSLIPTDVPPDQPVELVVRMNDEDLALRDFAAYLWLIDRIHGRMHEAGLASYAHRPSEYLRVTRLDSGSLEFIISDVGQFIDRNNLVLIWILLRGLPRAATYLSQSARNLASSYRDYEEGRLARSRRRELEAREDRYADTSRLVRGEIRELLREDPNLQGLPNNRVLQIARLVDALYQQERDNIPGAARFVLRSVRDVLIRIGSREF